MKNALLCLAVVGVAASVSGQALLPSHYRSFPASQQPTPSTLLSPITTGSEGPPPATEIPMWTYSVTPGADLGGTTPCGGPCTGQIIGRSPYLKSKVTTTIPLQIIPVKIVINNGGSDTHTYDPEINDGCVPVGHTAVDIVQNSPIFTNTAWTMDGVNVGTTQYHDAHLRASFWSLVGGTGYHLIENVTVLPEQTLYFGSVGNAGSTLGAGTNYNAAVDYGGCGYLGVLYVNDLVTAVNDLIGSLSPTVNIGTLPMILVDSVVSGETGASIGDSCCVLGFHSGFNVGPNLQVTSIFDLDYAGVFGNLNTSVIAHELGEAIFDPTGNNLTPTWGGLGQDYGNCPSGGGQNNLEVGDPLSPGYTAVANEHLVNPSTPENPSTDSNEWVIAGTGSYSGVKWYLQELTMFSWFFGGTNLGIPGYYSNNGTFQGDAVLCTSGGGTN